LTDLLGQPTEPKPNYHRPKGLGLPRCAGNSKPNDDRTLPTKPNEGNVNNTQSHKTDGKPKAELEQPH